ncbi:MAG TPA: hypothetical protein VGB17_08315 [Pyrinomonadaceae bacterium]|jgi:hypothetical protein
MRYLRQLFATAALTLMLALPVFAGEMGFPATPPPPNQPAARTATMDYPIVSANPSGEGAAINPTFDEALRCFLLNLLPIF